MTNYLAKLTGSQPTPLAVVMLTGLLDENNKPYYAFYALAASRIDEFSQAAATGKIDIADHGIIIEAFPGEPAAEILEMVKENFGESAVLPIFNL